jgi:hypothetical protein
VRNQTPSVAVFSQLLLYLAAKPRGWNTRSAGSAWPWVVRRTRGRPFRAHARSSDFQPRQQPAYSVERPYGALVQRKAKLMAAISRQHFTGSNVL